MFEISDNTARVSNVVAKPDTDGLHVDITVSATAEDGPKVLRQLHAHALAAACWDTSGESAMSDLDVRLRHKIEHCEAVFTAGKRKVSLVGDVSHAKFRPLSGRRLEVAFKVTAPASSADLAALYDAWADGEAPVTVREKQMSLDDVA